MQYAAFLLCMEFSRADVCTVRPILRCCCLHFLSSSHNLIAYARITQAGMPSAEPIEELKTSRATMKSIDTISLECC
jgi:hypothetical protein